MLTLDDPDECECTAGPLCRSECAAISAFVRPFPLPAQYIFHGTLTQDEFRPLTKKMSSTRSFPLSPAPTVCMRASVLRLCLCLCVRVYCVQTKFLFDFGYLLCCVPVRCWISFSFIFGVQSARDFMFHVLFMSMARWWQWTENRNILLLDSVCGYFFFFYFVYVSPSTVNSARCSASDTAGQLRVAVLTNRVGLGKPASTKCILCHRTKPEWKREWVGDRRWGARRKREKKSN